MEGYHSPVLLGEVIELLNVEKNEWYLDATLGDGGYSLEIIKNGGRIVGLDVDPQALERARKRLQGAGYSGGDFILIQGNFRDLKNLITAQMDPSRMLGANQKFAGAIFDLGVSSLQLESPQRGFSFSKEGPLDMRMDPKLGVRAFDLINILTRKELYELFSKLGEEKFAWAVAKAVVSARGITREKGLKTTKDLAELVEKTVGRKDRHIHPATRVFQALRIVVNDELNALKGGLDQVKDLIKNNGTILVISFHSLEDRIVKTTFKKWQSEGLGQILTKKPITPGEAEIRENPRSRSAKMRVFRRI